MGDFAFHIRYLSCKYPSSRWPVLDIHELDIPIGEIVFVVGASGVGKSTILETLGLMNNTIYANSSTIFNYRNGERTKEISTLWREGESALARFRKENLSFIFQSTNLFNSLTAFENICLSQIVQGKPREKAELDAKRMLKSMFDEETVLEIVQGKKVTELSGGQRQRLAFVRAVVTDYRILLADEPTGNLDWANANNLIKQLVNNVRDTGKTAIIVTHDINLALEYGDRVVFIRKMKDDKVENRVFGLIDQSSIYARRHGSWEPNGTNPIAQIDLEDYLKNQLS